MYISMYLQYFFLELESHQYIIMLNKMVRQNFIHLKDVPFYVK